ncbi:acyl-phosphate glycerol 3-phosphate acyltransferase [Pedobacter sp. PACM 27299]|uniref:lysophospholipid acyltransferase family protein n=1 Tax=Pedobacter sp. PACM 27299 TaxID=1727164 RepID=UPI000706A8FE|nr:lysophospholipid acyltransferase family protein [Pedobacter sp. PACM 27299]ALL05360.1 acyl-phosphate glycerol 3-phosphate acyltransferase [Pedobacter sp. PACM 27299]
MIRLLKHSHRLYSIFVILSLSVVFYPFYFAAAQSPKGYLTLNKLRKVNSFLSSWLTGIFFRFTFEQPLDKNQTYIYCANHTSNLDIMIFCILAQGKFHFMGKDALLKNPVLKIFFKTIDIPVNRDSKISAFRAFKKAGERLEAGWSLIIFPEGGIDGLHYPPVLQSFKNGPFRLAIEKNLAIVPVSLSDVWKKMWDDGSKYGSTPGICDIYIHQPVTTHNLTLTDADQLKERIFNLINSKLLNA